MKKLVSLTVVGCFLLMGLVARAGAQTTPRIYLDPTPLTLDQIGTPKTVEVVLEGVSESAGFEFEISFDGSVIQVDSIEVLSAPSDVQQKVVGPFTTIDGERGTVTFGMAVFCEEGVCPNILSDSSTVLATLTVSAVGEEGTATNLEFDVSYTLYGTEMGANDMPVGVEVTLTGGRVAVGEEEGPTVNLSRGWNRATLPEGFVSSDSLSALVSIEANCGSIPAISRKKNGWWESAVYDYGGASFALSEGDAAYIRVASGCVWSPPVTP